MGSAASDPTRRAVVAASTLGVTSLVLPSALASASDPSAAAVATWSGTLTFSDPTTSGFTVSWDPAA